MTIQFHKDFDKQLKRLKTNVRSKFKERIKLFLQDEFNPILNNHPLKGGYQGYRSINVTGDIRAIYKRETNSVMFITIDSHSNLYA